MKSLHDDWCRLAPGVMCRVGFTDDRMNCEWVGDVPSRRVFDRVLPQYREARDEFLRLVAVERGQPILVVEVSL